jgi:NADPH:quinone reductase-like Zn-dependent oxidoreductase
MGLDPKVKNMSKFLIQNLLLPGFVLVILLRFAGITDYYRLFGQATLAFLLWRLFLSIYRRMLLPAKDYRKMGRWVIVTGSTSGIGKAFAEYLAEKGMQILVISRSEEKLVEQVALLQGK